MKGNLIIVFFVELLAILSGVYSWRFLSLPYKLIWWQVVIAFLVENSARLISNYFHVSNIALYNVYALAEVWVLGIALKYLLESHKIQKNTLIILWLLTVAWLVITIENGIHVFNNWFILCTAFFYIIYCIVTLFDNSIFNIKKVYLQPVFIVCVSIIIYNATIIPLFGLINYLIDTDSKIATKLFQINTIASPVRYALIAIAFYLYARQAKRGYVHQ